MRSRPALAARVLLARLVLGGAALWLLACSAGPNQAHEGASPSHSSGGAILTDPTEPTREALPSGGGVTVDDEGTGGTDHGTRPREEPAETCETLEAARQVLTDQAVYFTQPFGRVLYSWTTAEQEQELRALGPLLSMGEAPLLGKGIAMDRLTERAAGPEASALDRALSERFATFRYAWPHPWATRLGMPGEDYGDRLVQMKLAPQAWIARINSLSGGIDLVVDLFGEVIPLDQAEQSIERIAALYYQHVATGQADAPDCYFGTFTRLGGSGGYREFIVGNPDMVEEWSLGTEEILARLQSDIQMLREYLGVVRPCPSSIAANFNAQVSCLWGQHNDPYYEALALPSDLYIPRAAQLANLIDTLESSLFIPDPLVRREGRTETDDSPTEAGDSPTEPGEGEEQDEP